MLWPDSSQTHARRSLSVAVSQLRRELPRSELLVTPGDTVGFRAGGIAVDSAAFVALVPNSLRSGQFDALVAATRLYRGAFLDGFSLPDAAEFEAWADGERQAWERRYLDALTTLVASYRAEGAFPEAIAAAHEALATDPLAEELHRSLIELYAIQGDTAAALPQFERCVVVLERELGVDPLPQTRAVYQAVRDGQYEAPPLRPASHAAVATALGAPLDAAQLWGAAAELGAAERWDLRPPDQLAYAQAVAQARVGSAPAAFDAAWQQGRATSLADASALANDVARRAAGGAAGCAAE